MEVREKDKWVRFTPYNGFKATLTIEFDHPVFNRSAPTFSIDFSGSSYIEEIARARTFGFMQEVELMRSHNLGLGGNLSNAVVIDETDVLNPEGLRYPRRIRPPQNPRRHRRPLHRRPPLHRRVRGLQIRPRRQQRPAAQNPR